MAHEGHAGRQVARRHIAFRLFLGEDAIAHHRSGWSDDAPAFCWTAPLSVMVSTRLDAADRDAAERRFDEFRKANEFCRHMLDEVEQREQRAFLYLYNYLILLYKLAQLYELIAF